MPGTRRISGKDGPRFDNWRTGILIGLGLPLLVMLIMLLTAWIRLSDALALRAYLLHGGTLGRMVAIATFFNVIPHGWFVHKQYWNACRGTILSTLILAIISMALHFLRATLEGL